MIETRSHQSDHKMVGIPLKSPEGYLINAAWYFDTMRIGDPIIVQAEPAD